MRTHRSISIVFLCASVTLNAYAAEDVKNTRQIMHGMYDAIAYLLPYSVIAQGEASELDKELIEKYLAQLTEGIGQLTRHSGNHGERFELLARSLEEINKEINDGFHGDWPEYSYYSLAELTQHCVACHSSLPGESRTLMGQKLLSRINPDRFSTNDLVSLMIATREFDAALARIERDLFDTQSTAREIDYSGLFLVYLRIAVNVRQQVHRPKTTLTRFLQRPDVPYYLRHRLEFWGQSFDHVEPVLAKEATLADAKSLLAIADTLTQVPGDLIRAVYDVSVANILQRYLHETPDATPRDKAWAYYQLGVIALRTFEINYSVPEMEYLFIAAINADPNGPVATDAYRLLEEFGYLGEEAFGESEALVQKVVDLTELRRKAGL